jgi:hypothetical protein
MLGLATAATAAEFAPSFSEQEGDGREAARR